MAYKGRFIPKHPEKYSGDPTRIVYRSLWERRVMNSFDQNPSVIGWSSEEVAVPYKSPVDERWHRYFPDFMVRTRDRDGKLQTRMIEVKPHSQTIQPPPHSSGQKLTRKYLNEVVQYTINSSKWAAAREYCADRGWQFVVLTEKELGIK